MFTCFYAPLQPLIVIPALFYFPIMGYARKIYLLTYCKKPRRGTLIIGKIMFYILLLGPFAFAIGLIYFSSFSNNFYFWTALNIIAIVLSIAVCVTNQIPNESLQVKVSDCKLFFSSYFLE